MTNSYHNHPLCIEAISRDVGTLPKLNDKFAVLWWKIIDEAPNLWMLCKRLYFPPNRLLSPKRCVRALWSKELVEPNHIE